eukprot:TRINITY_DN24973_c0_g1_i2.p1 TRINITY_DN24973_c0_g1~~TRINITY_DN24973_c0_g1_i2.p1  ORF type:complete len:508 (+),score=89.18 TRINITY_DN24973_c0_g1_i2:36-1559(+)
MHRRPPSLTLSSSSAASDVYKRQEMACDLRVCCPPRLRDTAPDWGCPPGVCDVCLVHPDNGLRRHNWVELPAMRLPVRCLEDMSVPAGTMLAPPWMRHARGHADDECMCTLTPLPDALPEAASVVLSLVSPEDQPAPDQDQLARALANPNQFVIASLSIQLSGCCVAEGCPLMAAWMRVPVRLVVSSLEWRQDDCSDGVAIITPATRISIDIRDSPTDLTAPLRFEELPPCPVGLEEEYAALISFAHLTSSGANHLSTDRRMGLVLHGDAGSGKSLLVHTLCAAVQPPGSFVVIDMADLLTAHPSEADFLARLALHRARLIVIDQMHLSRAGFAVTALLESLKNLPATLPVIITLRVQNPVGPIERAAQWVRRVHIGALSRQARVSIVRISSSEPRFSEPEICRIANSTAGFNLSGMSDLLTEIKLRSEMVGSATALQQALAEHRGKRSAGWPVETSPTGSLAQLGGDKLEKGGRPRLVRGGGVVGGPGVTENPLKSSVGGPCGGIV